MWFVPHQLSYFLKLSFLIYISFYSYFIQLIIYVCWHTEGLLETISGTSLYVLYTTAFHNKTVGCSMPSCVFCV